MEDANPNVRISAAHALRQARDWRALAALAQAMRDSVALVRATAVTSLGRLGDASVGPVVRVGLRDRDADVRSAAAEAMSRIRRAGG
jgi:HEAT repeat protein